MKFIAGLALCFGLLIMTGCFSRDEVQRSTSPDGNVDAILSESNCGAPCSFTYEIRLAPKGARSGERVAILDAATRSAVAWGVNVKWLDSTSLSIEYLRAESSTLEKQTVEIAGRDVKILLRSGVNDPKAPAGGMLYNLRGRP